MSKIMTTKARTINLPTLHKGGQRAIYLHPARFQVVACGRRFGKTVMGKVIIAEEIIKNGGEAWYVAPQYKMSTTIWRELLETFKPLAKWISAQERTIELRNGGKLVVWAGDTSHDSMRGGAPNVVVVDEAAMLKDGSLWFGVLMPALSDHAGKAYFLSTPRGRNWFYELYRNEVMFKDYKSWRFSSYCNPYINPKVIDSAKLSTPDKFFQQEYMAEFMLDAGDVFRNVNEVNYGVEMSPEAVDGTIVFGIDWGRKEDYTVISIMDADTKIQVSMERFSKIGWDTQKKAVMSAIEKWKPSFIAAEENSMGDVLISDMREFGVDIIPFYTTNDSKRMIIEELSLDIEKKNIVLLNEPVQTRELQAFQMDRTKAGKITYNAATGFHDDTVIALAIANHFSNNLTNSFGGAFPRIKGW